MDLVLPSYIENVLCEVSILYIYKYCCNFLDTKIDAEQAITMQMPWSVIKNNKRQTTNLYAMILISG